MNTTPVGLRVAVIGTGRMGLRHLDAVRNLGMTICGIADMNSNALESAGAKYKVPCFTDALDMLGQVRPEALVIATTAPSHASLVIAAAELGIRFILCEKPMATSLADAKAMIKVCWDHGVKLGINHQMRFMPQYTRVKELLGGKELGPLSSILVAGSNFGLAMNASHYFEMFRYLTDTSVESIQAWFDAEQLANPRGPQFEDRSGRLMAHSQQGQTIYIDFSATAGHGLQVVYICLHGQITIDELSGDMRVVSRKAEFRDLPTTRYGMPADTRQLMIEPADTVIPTMQVWSALLGGEAFPDGAAGLHALECLVAAHASHQANGERVRLDNPNLPINHRFAWA